jgi:dihydrolipoamide dehydrogenase
MAQEKTETQTVVLGAGPGGYAAAFLAADLGQSVVLIDRLENPGGVCLYWGCIPSKALLHAVRTMDDAERAAQWGISFGKPSIDIDKMREFKDGVIKRMTGGTGQLVKQRKITYIQGEAKFTDSHTLEVHTASGETQTVAFKNAIIAAGARSATLPFLKDMDPSRVLYAKSALDLESVPKSMLVIGGGFIGLELGSVYAKLGAKVSVVEMLPGIMAGADKDLVSEFEKANKNLFEEIKTETKVESVKEQKNGYKVTVNDGNESTDKTYEKLLVTVGNTPNTDVIGLENTKVETDDRGFIKVDKQRRTTEEHIFAIGDIAGGQLLAHKASHEGRVAAEVIAGHKRFYEPATIPSVVYTDPEIAWCGYTEAQAKEQGIEYEVASFPWAASGRAVAMGESVGKTKMLIDPKTERVLGVGIVGRDAGELISEGVLAVEMAALASDVSLSVHPHPTLSETLMEAAESFYGTSTHIYRPKKK